MASPKKSSISNPQSPISDALHLIDTHCHIHDSKHFDASDDSLDKVIDDAEQADVTKLVCVGTRVESSVQAVELSKKRDNCYATVAIHPHQAAEMTEKQMKDEVAELEKLIIKNQDRPVGAGVVAIGECGLDYFYHDDPKTHEKQEKLLRLHLELAVKYDLPLVFHVRDQKDVVEGELGNAFAHFFEVIKDYPEIRGVMHSFSAGMLEMKGAVGRGFYIGLNGIMTFSKSEYQLEAARSVPIDRLLLETDAPFLTPAPFRGKMCEPKHIRVTAEFLSNLRGENLEELAKATTANAQKLLGLK